MDYRVVHACLRLAGRECGLTSLASAPPSTTCSLPVMRMPRTTPRIRERSHIIVDFHRTGLLRRLRCLRSERLPVHVRSVVTLTRARAWNGT